MKQEQLILVDTNDKAIGSMEKLEVHQRGLLHRAFSVFIFNSRGELLLQQRASEKYHSGGLWANTCCSHPRSGEELYTAVSRRLHEEIGLHCRTEYAFHFIYKAALDNGLTEHELDHVFIGTSDALPLINTNEVQNWRYISLDELKKDIRVNPAKYAAWLRICLDRVIDFIDTNKEMTLLNEAI